jgi:Cu/Ag efflux pump CusA
MLEKIVALALKQKGMILFFVLLVVAFGVYSYATLPIDAFPDVTNIQVDVVSYASGLSAVEIERSVTFPIEMSMRGLPRVKQMRSVTKFGLSLVTIIFEEDVDIYFAGSLSSKGSPKRKKMSRKMWKWQWDRLQLQWARSISSLWKARCPSIRERRRST